MTNPNTSDRDVTRAIRSWLHEDRHEDASRIAGAVLDQVPTTPQRRAIWWRARRFFHMNTLAKVLVAAAAVVVVAVMGINLLPGLGGGIGSQPTPSPTVVPSPSDEPTTGPTPAGLAEGPHLILDGQTDVPEETFPPLTVTIPAPGWDGEVGGGVLVKNDAAPPAGAGMIMFVQSEYIVYGDACHWTTTMPDTPVTTVDDFIDALSAQASRRASEPVDITLGGYAGKSITLTVPDDVDLADCDPGFGGSWDCGGDGMTPCGYHGGADAIDTVYILDIDGLIMAWQTGFYTGTSTEDVAELEAIVQSASFGE